MGVLILVFSVFFLDFESVLACFVRSAHQVCSLRESFVVLDAGEGEVRGRLSEGSTRGMDREEMPSCKTGATLRIESWII